MSLKRRDLLALGAAAVAAPALAAEPAGPWTGGGTLRTTGGKLRYATLGPPDGEPLVLLHRVGGWLADWRHAAPALAGRRRVVAIDLPGHGGSVMDGAPPEMITAPQLTTTILCALEELGIDRFAIAGNSLGGIAGIVAAACWPEKVSKLVVISSSLIPAMTRAEFHAAYAGAPAPVAAPASGPSERQLRMFATIDPAIIQEQAASNAVAAAWLRPMERGVARAGVTDYLPRLTQPTLLINADRGNYAKYGAVGLELIPKAREIVIGPSGAFVHQEKPAETAAAINAFLNEPA